MARPSSFMVSAPGKVIVFGEHAVVHGKAAIAAATSLRSYLLVTFEDSVKDSVTLDFQDIAFHHTWSLDYLKNAAASFPPAADPQQATKALDETHVAALENIIKDIGQDETNEVKKAQHHNAAKAFLYLFLSLGLTSHHGCIFSIRSTLPIGAGLGSSASLSVCLSSAMLYMRQLLTVSPNLEDTDRMVHLLNNWAFVGEMCLHGNPSGVDNSVATFGKAVMFQRSGVPGAAPTITPLANFPEVRLLMVDTCVSRSTAKEVEKVRVLKTEYPVIVDPLLESISQITKAANDLFDARAQTRLDQLPGPKLSFLEKLGQLFQMNHGLLVSLGVSHPKLERIRQLTDEGGVGWTKLTGAGGGGCAITLLNENPVNLKQVEEKLVSESFKMYELVLGAPGVGLHLNPSQITREALMGAKTTDEINAVVGDVDGGHSQSWHYWSGA